jgi:hypothetical protein
VAALSIWDAACAVGSTWWLHYLFRRHWPELLHGRQVLVPPAWPGHPCLCGCDSEGEVKVAAVPELPCLQQDLCGLSAAWLLHSVLQALLCVQATGGALATPCPRQFHVLECEVCGGCEGTYCRPLICHLHLLVSSLGPGRCQRIAVPACSVGQGCAMAPPSVTLAAPTCACLQSP